MSVREAIKNQIIAGLANAKFPITTPQELLSAFPNGADTACKAGDLEVTAGQAGKLLSAEDFPFTNAQHAAETIVTKAGL